MQAYDAALQCQLASLFYPVAFAKWLNGCVIGPESAEWTIRRNSRWNARPVPEYHLICIADLFTAGNLFMNIKMRNGCGRKKRANKFRSVGEIWHDE